MKNLMKSRRILGVSIGIFVIALLLIYASATGLLRPAYLAALTELRLAWRREPLVRIRIAARDGMNQIYIPAGEFSMGSNGRENSSDAPVHKVYLDAYWIDQVEVTNAMYAICLEAQACKHPARYNNYFSDRKYADFPMVYIKWVDAQRFCEWEGGHLPTEAQWEKAARGARALRYPWGNGDPDVSLLNYNDDIGNLTPSYDYLIGMSPYGLLNMAGNVREWVWDWFNPNYYRVSPYRDPLGAATGKLKSLRGGSDWDNAQEVETFFRLYHLPISAGQNRGFRCAMDAN
jgi:formylglycine-generating enzyme required for sulfatase activity